MTTIQTIAKNVSNRTFTSFKENAEILANAFEKRIHEREGGNKQFKASDRCLSFKGKEMCYLFIIDENRTTYKLDPNTNTIQLIINCDD